MDMLERMKDKWNNGVINATLKRALAFYIFIGLLTALLCSMVMILFFENWKSIVYQVHGATQAASDVDYGIAYRYMGSMLSETAKKQITILNLMEIVSVIACAVIAIACVSHQFYKKKLEEPLKILQTEMQYLGRDDLSFECSYVCKDEMGDICQTFNQMRIQLFENKRNLWDLMESQRELNAAFAHDIRTPLTVMKGYIQMLSNYYPTGKISEEKMLETLQMLDRQVGRMERFSNTMKEIHTIDEWKICQKSQTLQDVLQKIRRNIKGMSTDRIQITLQEFEMEDRVVVCDENLIQEVVDNLILNALRFADSDIQIMVRIESDKLYLYVKDDGKGFTKEALENGSRPYFSTSEEHFGLGLTICQTLCKKHGGNLELMNSIEGGAVACAYLYIK